MTAVSQLKSEIPPTTASFDCSLAESSRVLCSLQVSKEFERGGDDGAEVTVTNATSREFLDVRAVTNNVLVLDLAYTSSVPEPGTLGIVGLGGVLTGLLRRKRNQN